MNGESETPEIVTLVDLIDRLAEPAAPDPVQMIPQTAGWAVLAAILALLLAWLAWRGIRRWRANGYRRAALAELAAAGDDGARIAAVLRRAALSAWPRTQVAHLTGEAWPCFLNETGGDFTGETAAALLRAPYRDETVSRPDLHDAAACWIRRHRVGAEAKS